MREERAIKDLTKHVENLENEKQFFISEIDKLKKELAASRKREEEAGAKAAAAAKNNAAQAHAGGGWFGFGGGAKEEKKDEKLMHADSLDLSAISPKVSTEQPTRTVSEILDDDKPKRLSDLLDF